MGGGIFLQKVDLSSTQGALCTVSVFFILHFNIWECVRTQRTPLPVDALFFIMHLDYISAIIFAGKFQTLRVSYELLRRVATCDIR